MNKILKIKKIKTALVLIILMTSSFVGFSQEAASVASTEISAEDTRTIAEWSVFSGTQIFAILMIIMLALVITVFVLSGAIKNLLKSDKFKQRLKSGLKVLILLIGFSLISDSAIAGSKSPEENSIIQLSDTMFWAMLSVNLVLILVILYLRNFMKWILREMNQEAEVKESKESWWDKLMTKLTDAVPIEKEEVVMTDHEYDGIRELDNNLPPWWVYGFYVTIVFAFIYIFHFHVFKTGDLQAAEYEKEMKTADEEVQAYLKSQANNVDEFNATTLTDAADLSEGKTIFETNCWQCHKKDGGGQTGPNLTDDYWIHGGDIKDIFKTVKYGVTSKSMPSWKDQLTPMQIQRVSSYVKSLVGTNPPEAKAPEGELYKEGNEKTENTEATLPESDTLAVQDTLK